jgi:hypothetical protein
VTTGQLVALGIVASIGGALLGAFVDELQPLLGALLGGLAPCDRLGLR